MQYDGSRIIDYWYLGYDVGSRIDIAFTTFIIKGDNSI